jgi:hypothetical protein
MVAKNVDWTLLDRCCTHGQQSLEYRAIWQTGKHKMRVRRKRDFYDFQSYAIIERWNGEKWLSVESIPYREMTTGDGDSSSVIKDVARPVRAELADEEELIRLASLILDTGE